MIARSVTVMLDPECIHSEWHSEMIRGIRKSASAAQRTVQVIDLPREGEPPDETLVDPVILTGFSLKSLMTTIRMLTELGKRIILAGIDADSLSSQVSCVTHSRSQQTIQLIRYLQACGRGRIALLGIGENSVNDLVKVNAAERYTADQPCPVTANDVFMWRQHPQECFDAFWPVANRYNAILCPNDYLALLAINQFKARGFSVPEDFYLVSFSNLLISRFCQPTITTITMDFAAIGKYAFSIWQQLQTLNERELVSKIVAPSRLLIRGSTDFNNPEAVRQPVRLWDDLQKDYFYDEPSIRNLMQIESCLNRHDSLDLKIIEGLLQGVSYEAMAEKLYISPSALHYRLSKLYRDLGCPTRKAFERRMRSAYGEFVNPE